jgi:hypothetical protein
MIRSLFQAPHTRATASLAPPAVFIFFLHSFTTGRIPRYLDHYLNGSRTDFIKPICVSLEYDALYLTAFVSFFLVLPFALASRIGNSILRKQVESRGTDSSPSQSFEQFQGAVTLILAFIVIHSFLLPLLLYFPFGEPLWVEHNFARNAVFLSFILLVVGLVVFIAALPLQLLGGDKTNTAHPKHDEPVASLPPRSPTHDALFLFFGTPLSCIAFWLISSICVLLSFRAITFFSGNIHSPGLAAVILIASVISLGITLATIVGQRLQIWQSPLRAIILIAVVSFALHLSAPQTFPIDWFETCAIWTD